MSVDGPGNWTFARVRQSVDNGLEPTTSVRRSRPSNLGCSNPWSEAPYPLPDFGVVKEKVVHDNPTPGYHKLVAKGGPLPVNPFYIRNTTTETWAETPNYIVQTGGNKCRVVEYDGKFGWNDTAALELSSIPGIEAKVAAAVQWCTNAAVANAKKNVFDALTFAAELGKTVAMFRELADRISELGTYPDDFDDGIDWDDDPQAESGSPPDKTTSKPKDPPKSALARARRDGRLKREREKAAHDRSYQRAKRASNFTYSLGQIPKDWMQYRYGIMPLVYALDDAVQGLERWRKYAKVREDGRSTFHIPVSHSTTETVQPSGHQAGTYTTRQIIGEIVVRGNCLVSVPSVRLADFDPLVTGHELVRFSWMIDWVINVGDWLQAIDASGNAGAIEACSASIRCSYITASTQTVTWSGGVVDGSARYGSGLKTYTRTVDSYLRFPSSVQFPPVVLKMSELRWTDASALALSRLRVFQRMARGLFETMRPLPRGAISKHTA